MKNFVNNTNAFARKRMFLKQNSISENHVLPKMKK